MVRRAYTEHEAYKGIELILVQVFRVTVHAPLSDGDVVGKYSLSLGVVYDHTGFHPFGVTPAYGEHARRTHIRPQTQCLKTLDQFYPLSACLHGMSN